MSLEISTQDNVCTLKIVEELTIFQVGEYHQQLISECNFKQQILLDCSTIEDVDTAGIQLILSMEKQFNEAGGQVLLLASSPVMDEGLQVFNLQNHFKATQENEKGES